MSSELIYLDPVFLTDTILEKIIYPDPDQEYYWSDCWRPEFYCALAWAGFICVASKVDGYGTVLIPEMQKSYALLDWDRVHVSRKVRKIIRSGRLADDAVHLVITREMETVVRHIQVTYESCWLDDHYLAFVKELAAVTRKEFALVSVQIRSGRHGLLLGGELGYFIGATYTSLSGFINRSTPYSNHMGTVQLLSLAGLLKRAGYRFWNLGHPYMDYKLRIGARIVPRAPFLRRWKEARIQDPETAFTGFVDRALDCQELLSEVYGGPALRAADPPGVTSLP